LPGGLVRKAGIDDPLDAFAVHACAGAWSVLSLGFFHMSLCAFYGHGGDLLAWQAPGVVTISPPGPASSSGFSD
jgi:Amt family ammonium transporter